MCGFFLSFFGRDNFAHSRSGNIHRPVGKEERAVQEYCGYAFNDSLSQIDVSFYEKCTTLEPNEMHLGEVLMLDKRLLAAQRAPSPS